MVEIHDTALIIIDVQEKLFPKIQEKDSLQRVILQAIEACQILGIPIIVSEQYPKGLGPTIEVFREKLARDTPLFDKLTFSALKNEPLLKAIEHFNKKNWILVGIESHICILQSALDFVKRKQNVIVLEDAIGSRHLYHKESALSEMKKNNIRISCLETLIFELLGHAKHSNFKEISALFR